MQNMKHDLRYGISFLRIQSHLDLQARMQAEGALIGISSMVKHVNVLSATTEESAGQTSWYWVFEAHLYVFAVAWFLVALYSVVTIVNLHSLVQYITLKRSVKQLLSRTCSILCLTAMCRAAYLLVDPYESRDRIPQCASRTLYIVCEPGYLGVFMYIFVSQLSVTNVRICGSCSERCCCPSRKIVATVSMLFWYSAMIVSELIFCSSTIAYGNTEQNVAIISIQLSFVTFSLFVYLAFIHYGMKMIRFVGRGANRDVGYRCYRIRKSLSSTSPRATVATVEIVPKIRITDENDCTVSYNSGHSRCTSTASTLSNDLTVTKQSFLQKCQSKLRDFKTTDATLTLPGMPASGLVAKAKSLSKRKRRQQQPSPPASGTESDYSHRKSENQVPCKTRAQRLQSLVRSAYCPVVCGLLLCAWQFYDCISKHILECDAKELIHRWPYVVFLIAYRLTEIIMCSSSVYLIQNKFSTI